MGYKERRVIKDKRINRAPGFNLDKLIVKRGRELEEDFDGLIKRTQSAVALSPQSEILENENDLQMLSVNEVQYKDALSQSQAGVRVMRILKSWGASDEELDDFFPQEGESGADTLRRTFAVKTRLMSGDRKRQAIFSGMAAPLLKAKTAYRDELDQLIHEQPGIFTDVPLSEITMEQIRCQSETLELIRMQIDFLKKKQKQERKLAQTPKKGEIVAPITSAEGDNLHTGVPETGPEAAGINAGRSETEHGQNQTEREPLMEPFGLREWQVFWTDSRFSTNPNHLIEIPTGSKKAFTDKMNEVNAGRKIYQIKDQSVASCIEMWAIPEFRKRAMGARFKWGPSYVRDWAKLVRGPVRIMVNSNEEEKKLVFFAADRDRVYRGIFAGMSS